MTERGGGGEECEEGEAEGSVDECTGGEEGGETGGEDITASLFDCAVEEEGPGGGASLEGTDPKPPTDTN